MECSRQLNESMEPSYCLRYVRIVSVFVFGFPDGFLYSVRGPHDFFRLPDLVFNVHGLPELFDAPVLGENVTPTTYFCMLCIKSIRSTAVFIIFKADA